MKTDFVIFLEYDSTLLFVCIDKQLKFTKNLIFY